MPFSLGEPPAGNQPTIPPRRSGAIPPMCWGVRTPAYGSDDEDHDFFGTAPVVGLAVDSFREAHTAMAEAGVEFVYPEPQRANGVAWQHFRAPDGNVYEIIGPDDRGMRP